MNREGTKALGLLRHYLMMAFEAGGLPWDADNDKEVEQLVEHLIEAGADRAEEIDADREELRSRIRDAREGRG